MLSRKSARVEILHSAFSAETRSAASANTAASAILAKQDFARNAAPPGSGRPRFQRDKAAWQLEIPLRK
jgi:hypothetical protein